MKNLFKQIIKFGIVGAICFVIDYALGLAVLNIIMAVASDDYFETASVLGSVVGFTVSVIVNYFLSFRFVFIGKQNLNKKVQFIAFFVLSVIGLALNSFLIWLAVGPIYENTAFLHENIGYNLMYTGAKIFATAVVTVYNFVTRKIFLEQKNMEGENNK